MDDDVWSPITNCVMVPDGKPDRSNSFSLIFHHTFRLNTTMRRDTGDEDEVWCTFALFEPYENQRLALKLAQLQA